MRAFLLVACWLPGVFAGETDGSYFRDVRPILQRQCQGCHQPAVKSSGLDLTTFDGLAKGGKHGPAFRPGAADSLIVKYIKGEQQPAMPLGAPPLTAEQIASISSWIAAGAKNDTPAEVKDNISQDRPPLYHQPPVISALQFSPDGNTLAVSGYRELLLHKADGSGLIARLVGQSERLNSIAYSADGSVIVAAGGRHLVEDLDVHVLETFQRGAQVGGRGHVLGQEIVDLVESQVTLFASEVDQALKILSFVL